MFTIQNESTLRVHLLRDFDEGEKGGTNEKSIEFNNIPEDFIVTKILDLKYGNISKSKLYS